MEEVDHLDVREAAETGERIRPHRARIKLNRGADGIPFVVDGFVARRFDVADRRDRERLSPHRIFVHERSAVGGRHHEPAAAMQQLAATEFSQQVTALEEALIDTVARAIVQETLLLLLARRVWLTG